MVEAAMYVALGILAAGLVALMLIPPFWRRALRLARRDIEATLPMTRSEIDADKDQLRAGFAVSTRRLENTIERLETRVATREAELGQKREIITHLTQQNSLTASGVGALETQRDHLQTTLATRDRQIAEADEMHKADEKRIADIESRLEAARRQLEAVIAEREAQKLEFVARETELANLRDQIMTAARAAGSADGRSDELAELRTRLASEQVRREAALEELRSGEAARRALEIEVKAAAITLASVREELAAAEARNESLAARRAEAQSADAGLAAMREERTGLLARIAALEAANLRLEEAGSQTAPSSATDPGESAALRRKLIEIGEAVARLSPVQQPATTGSAPPTQTDAGTGIVPMLPPPAAAAAVPDRPAAPPPRGLAERIRALQQSSKSA